jgi:poly(beta-D-mannuronate) lyase
VAIRWLGAAICLSTLAVTSGYAQAQTDGASVAPDRVEAIRAAIKSARPGDTIDLPSGSYRDAALVFDAIGEEGRLIRLRASEPGKAVFTGTSSLRIAGKHLVVEGILFTGATETRTPPIQFTDTSADCRLTDSGVVDFIAEFANRFHYVRIGGTAHRVDHCLFSGKANQGPVVAADGGMHVRIDHNHFRDIPHNPANGREIIQVMGIGSNDEPLDAGGAHWLIEQNLFERAHGEGAEIISIKSNFNLVRGNTVRATKGALTMRSGGATTFEGNFIFGDGMSGSAGLRISGAKSKAINNYIHGVSGVAIQLHAGEYILKDLTGQYEPLARRGAPLGRVARYLQMVDSVVSNNVVVETRETDLLVGSGYATGWPGSQRILLPDNLTFTNNLFVARRDPQREMVRLVLEDEKAQLLPADARPRPVIGRNNFLFGARVADSLPKEFGFRTEDPKLMTEADGLYRPAPDSPAISGGFDAAGMRNYPPIGPADVGPAWNKPTSPRP